jgi:hypothetical protein
LIPSSDIPVSLSTCARAFNSSIRRAVAASVPEKENAILELSGRALGKGGVGDKSNGGSGGRAAYCSMTAPEA